MLEPAQCWIQHGAGCAGSSAVLDPARCWIQHGAGSSTALDLHGGWIQHGAGSALGLDPAQCWIGMGSGSSTALDLTGRLYPALCVVKDEWSASPKGLQPSLDIAIYYMYIGIQTTMFPCFLHESAIVVLHLACVST